MANFFQTEWEAPDLDSLASLAENLVYRIRGCDDTLLRKTLQEVAREFVADTQCLTSRQTLVPGAGGLYYPVPVFRGKIADVREVWKDRRLLRKGIDWNWPVGSGLRIAPRLVGGCVNRSSSAPAPSDSRRYPPSVNMMDAEPSEHKAPASPFVAVVVEHLPLFFENLPREFLQSHGDAICSGVMARLCSMSGRPWSDPQVAALERTNYENAKSELRMSRETPLDGQFIDTSMVL